MVLPRFAALRASSIARCARPARFIRRPELQPWQRMVQRRTYASEHGAHGEQKTSDIPWIATAALTLTGGLYLVINQDLGGGHGDDHGEEHGEAHHEEKKEEEPAPEPAEEKEEKAEEKKGDSKDDKEEKKDEDKKESSDEDPKPPSSSDKPDPSKEPKSQNETSGKQAGMSNDDTGHSTPVAENPEKSSKGEGVAETAKVKGAVDPERPQAENKEERGKTTQDKSK